MHPFDENKRAWRVVGHFGDGRRCIQFINAETWEDAQTEAARREPVTCVEKPVEIDGKTGERKTRSNAMTDSTLNGAGTPRALTLPDLRSWALCYTAQDGGLLGHIEHTTGDNEHMPDVVLLSPAYVFRGNHSIIVGNAPNGQPAPMFLAGAFMVGAFEFLSAPLRLPVRPTIFVPLAVLNETDFADLGGKILAGVQGAEQARMQVRAQNANIALAGPGMRLPPMPGGRRG
jgi:hypothetical protein